MDCILNCLNELRAKRQELTEAIFALERLGAGGAAKRRGRPPKWLSAMQQVETAEPGPVEMKPRVVKPAPKKEKKRAMSAEGKLAIQVGVVLRQWKSENPDATEEAIAKQRDRIRQQLQRKAS